MQIISADLRSSKRWELTEEGTETAEHGSHEARVFGSIPLEGLAQSELMVSAAELGCDLKKSGVDHVLLSPVETVLWEDRLQQSHVQQVDQTGQRTRGGATDIQECMCGLCLLLVNTAVCCC